MLRHQYQTNNLKLSISSMCVCVCCINYTFLSCLIQQYFWYLKAMTSIGIVQPYENADPSGLRLNLLSKIFARLSKLEFLTFWRPQLYHIQYVTYMHIDTQVTRILFSNPILSHMSAVTIVAMLTLRLWNKMFELPKILFKSE